MLAEVLLVDYAADVVADVIVVSIAMPSLELILLLLLLLILGFSC